MHIGFGLRFGRSGGSAPPESTAPVISGFPTISGTAEVGAVLTAIPASVTGTPTPTRTWQWLRDGLSISGATSGTYTLVSDDGGTDVSVRQTETNLSGSDSQDSASVAVSGGLSLTEQVQALFATLGATNGAMYDFLDASTLSQDTAGTVPVTAYSDVIGRAADISGFNRHQLQSTSTARPLWSAGGASFDGVDDVLVASITSATQQNHYIASSYAVSSWFVTAAGQFRLTLYGGSNIFFAQALRADSDVGSKVAKSSYRNGSLPTQRDAANNAAGYVLGAPKALESLLVPNTSVNASLSGEALITTTFTGVVANNFTTIGYAQNAVNATAIPKVERRAIWMALPSGTSPDATQRELIRSWLLEGA